MKKLLLILAIGAFVACNDAADKAVEENKDSTVNAIENKADSTTNKIDSTAGAAIDSTKKAADSLKK